MMKSKIFKLNFVLVLVVLLAFCIVQSFAGPNITAAKTKISTVNWNMMSRSASGGRSNTNLYWLKFSFLDKATSSATIQEICSNEFRQLKSQMNMPGYFYSFYSDGACPNGEKYGMGIIFRGQEITHQLHTFRDQKVFTRATPPYNIKLQYGNGARGMICVKHRYLGKSISSCVTHIDFDMNSSKSYIKNNYIGNKQLKQYKDYGTMFSLGAGGAWNKSDVTFLNGDFNQYPDAVAKYASGYKSLVKQNTHNALEKSGPRIQLDYILVPNNITGELSFINCKLNSDHCMTGGSVWV
mgnify:CR=1 FL=1